MEILWREKIYHLGRPNYLVELDSRWSTDLQKLMKFIKASNDDKKWKIHTVSLSQFLSDIPYTDWEKKTSSPYSGIDLIIELQFLVVDGPGSPRVSPKGEATVPQKSIGRWESLFFAPPTDVSDTKPPEHRGNPPKKKVLLL